MTQRRTFTAEFKSQMVLDLMSGVHSVAKLYWQHQLNPQLLSRWKTEFLEGASLMYEQETTHFASNLMGGSTCE